VLPLQTIPESIVLDFCSYPKLGTLQLCGTEESDLLVDASGMDNGPKLRRITKMKMRGAWTKGTRIIVVTTVVCALVLFLGVHRVAETTSGAGAGQTSVSSNAFAAMPTRDAHKGLQSYGRLPLTFEENVGQTAREVRYVSRGSGYQLFLTTQEAVLALRDRVRPKLSPRHRFGTLLALRKARLVRQKHQLTAIRLRFDAANPEPQIVGVDEAPGKVNYFFGNDPRKWRTNVPAYTRVKYTDIYPGIDLVFYGNQGRLEYDFVVAPGADPTVIQLNVQGAKRLRINAKGDLVLKADNGEIEFQKPVMYQEVNGKRREIVGGYTVAGNRQVKFTVGEYDRREPLILDPVLNYSTYLGGSSDDDAAAIAVDSNNNVIVAGTTFSTDFPTSVGGFQTSPLAANVNGASAAFVTELDPTGTQLKYSSYLAGSTPFEFAFGVDVDAAGMIYVTGTTVSTDFPTSSLITGFKPTSPANINGTSFITKLDPTASGASSLLYSSYLGGTDGAVPIGDIGQAVAADPKQNGVVYVTGYTDSTAGLVTDTANFPVVGGFLTTLGSPNGNAFLSKIDTTVSGTGSLLYSTYFGGNAVNFNGTSLVADFGGGIAVDSSSNAYVAGVTFSTDLGTTANAVQLTYPASNTTNTAFVARIDTTLTGAGSLIYLSYLGGTGPDFGDAIAVGPGNVAYVTGKTDSLNFPTTTGAFSTTSNGSGVAYLTLVNTTAAPGTSPVYSTFLGGSGGDNGFGIRVDASGNAYVAGGTSSSNFPVTPGAFQQAMATNAVGDGFISKVNPGGNASADLVYSSYFGGSGSAPNTDEIEGIAIDTSNNVYVTGQTLSSAAFPVFPNPGAFQMALNGPSDAFVAKLTLIPTLSVAPASLDFGTQPVSATSAPQTVTLTNNTSDPIPFANSALSFTGTNAADFASPSNTCGASIAASASCTVGVTFTPSVSSAESATLVITVTITNGGLSSSQSFSVSLTGAGGSASAPGVGLSPASLTFGGQLETTASTAQTITLTNTGTGALIINSIVASGDFAQTNNCPISPATLAATGTCVINVTFSPTAVGPRTGTLTITDNASDSPQRVALSGTGWDFRLTAPSTVSIRAKKSVNVNVTMTPLGGFNQAVALACSVELRKKSTCVVDPALVTAIDGVTPQVAVVNVMDKGLIVLPPSTPTLSLSTRQIVPLILSLLLLFMLFTASRLRTRLAMATAAVILVAMAGCGYVGTQNGATRLNEAAVNPTNGKYTLTVTGTSGRVTKTVKVILTVK
jgi:centrosomal CEP192-like protein/beta-propeller repeat-containing protein